MAVDVIVNVVNLIADAAVSPPKILSDPFLDLLGLLDVPPMGASAGGGSRSITLTPFVSGKNGSAPISRMSIKLRISFCNVLSPELMNILPEVMKLTTLTTDSIEKSDRIWIRTRTIFEKYGGKKFLSSTAPQP